MKRALVVGMLCTMLGCAGAGTLPSSRRAFEAVAAAMARDDGDRTLYAMLPEAERVRVSPEAFRRQWQRVREERRRAAEAAQRALREGGPVGTLVTREAELTLVEEPDGWHVADPMLGPPAGARVQGRAGIRAALRGVHRALRQRDLSGVMALLSSRLRGAVEGELSALLSATQDPDALDVPEIPGPTRVRLGDGRAVIFVWEDGQWRIDDIVGP